MNTQIFTNLNQEVTLNDANRLKYGIDQSLLQINTILICQIEVINSDGSCDVRSIINYIDNAHNPVTPPLQFNLPKLEIRGGIAGIIVEPIVGDTVIVGYCQRDITTIKKTLTRQNPASLRKFSLSDGIILGIVAKTPPSIYVKITKNGMEINTNDQPINITTTANANINAKDITITAENSATIKAPKITLDGKIDATSTLNVANSITTAQATIDNKDFATHIHSNGNQGSPTGGVI